MKSPLLFARPLASAARGETALRYGAATAVTLIALAATQLVVSTQFVLWLAATTLVGVPVSLWLRGHDGRVGRVRVPRPLWNAATVLATGAASAHFLRSPLQHILNAVRSGSSESLLQMGQTEPMILLVQLFLLFAAFRSWTLLSDKDATLTTVPSFSVLLLLIPVHRSVEVVCYFLAWTVAATVLFALEHRSEMRALVVAAVPAPAPGQEVKLAARSLVSVLGISLAAAIALSGFLTARDPSESSSSESAVALMASRWTQWGMEWMNGPSASGPERQIDFSTSTALPTRAIAWRARARLAPSNPQEDTQNNAIYPAYWRLFTLSKYDGSTWLQSNEQLFTVTKSELARAQWPRRRFGFRSERQPTSDTPRFAPSNEQAQRERTHWRFDGFPIAPAQPALAKSFGFPTQGVYFRVVSARPNLGFAPILVAPTSLILPNSPQNSLRVRADGSVDVNLTDTGQNVVGFAQVARVPENGFPSPGPPRQNVARRANSPRLGAAERALYTQLPAKVPTRVRQLARDVLRRAPQNASNYARAQLLAQETQRGAIYTLRPPAVPPEREAADFFLFESRRGFCTYFAGSLTVLCRSAGIPARVVTGFASEERDGEGQTVLRDANLHAWTEVWIENWGWASVDATPAGDRGDNAPTFLENWGDFTAANLDALQRTARAHWPTLASGFTLLLLSLLAWRARRWIARRVGSDIVAQTEAQRREIAQHYRTATRELARRFRPRAAWETPDEWLVAATKALPDLPREPLESLTALYVRAHFSPRELEADAAQKARELGSSVTWRGREIRRKVGAR